MQKITFKMLFIIIMCSEELDKFMESQGATAPGILTLTTSLSKPFMRLDKYPTLLQELERHVEVTARHQTHRQFYSCEFLNNFTNDLFSFSGSPP